MILLAYVMDSEWVIWFTAVLCCVSMYLFFNMLLMKKTKASLSLPLPPGPPGWPIVGNLFQLGGKPNESLYSLSQKYGPLMTLSLGMTTTVVVSSTDMAKEVLKTHDHVFAGRTVIQSVKTLSHHESSLAWGQQGPYWRKLRRISATELMTNNRLQALQHLRRDEVSRTIRLIFEEKGKSVNIPNTLFYTGLNLISNMIFSRSLFHPDDPDSVEFKDAITTAMNLAGKPNLADYFPVGFLDCQGLTREIAKYFKKIYGFIDGLVEDRLATRSKGVAHQKHADKDFLDVVLDMKRDDLSFINIRALIFELLTGGSDTSSVTMEWAMASMIRNPDVMKRAKEELEEVVGLNRRVEESDIDNLPYLQAVVKEVLRLHPPVPLSLPHRADNSCEIAGFLIPKHTQVIVNLWAIARDPAIWKKPSKFMPERFLKGENGKLGFKGQDFEFIPFGAGRRICPGLPLATRMVHFTVASLVHSFDWSLPDGMHAEELDMSDKFGIVLKKAQDLHAIPIPTLQHHLY